MKILGISWSSHTSINRQIFRLINKYEKVTIKVIIPKGINILDAPIECDAYINEKVDFIPLEVKGSNPRYNRYSGIYKVLNNYKPDIIYHEDDPISLQALQYGFWVFINRKKLICKTNQNTNLTYKSEIGRKGLIKGLVKTTLKLLTFKISSIFIDHILTISNEGSKVFKNLGFKNITKMPLGFDENIFKINNKSRREVRDKLKIKGFTFAYIGRRVEEKGLHILLESLSRIKKYKWNLLLDNFEMYGKNNNKSLRSVHKYKKRAYDIKIESDIKKWGIEDRIIYFQSDHYEISSFMNASDVVVMPSITTNNFKEEYGRVAPEAMACGCLVIASNSGTLPELIADKGWIFKESDTNDLSNLLIKAINYDKRIKMGLNGSKYSHKYLSVKVQAKILMRVMNGIIQG